VITDFAWSACIVWNHLFKISLYVFIRNSGTSLRDFWRAKVTYPRAETRVSFETSFDSKQPKLEPKLVSALSETKGLFRLFRSYTETESFDVSIEPNQTEDQPKQNRIE
jgi:hypothetical protein